MYDVRRSEFCQFLLVADLFLPLEVSVAMLLGKRLRAASMNPNEGMRDYIKENNDFPSINLGGFLTAGGSWETSPPSLFSFFSFFPLFIRLPSSGKPRAAHPTDKMVTLGFVQNPNDVNDWASRTRQRRSFALISL